MTHHFNDIIRGQSKGITKGPIIPLFNDNIKDPMTCLKLLQEKTSLGKGQLITSLKISEERSPVSRYRQTTNVPISI